MVIFLLSSSFFTLLRKRTISSRLKHLKRTRTAAPEAAAPRSPSPSSRRRCSLKSLRWTRSACGMRSAAWPRATFCSEAPSRSTNCTKSPLLYFTGRKTLSRHSTEGAPSTPRVRAEASAADASSTSLPGTLLGSAPRTRTSTRGLKALASSGAFSLLAEITSHQRMMLLPSRLELCHEGRWPPPPGRRVHTALTSRPASSIASLEGTRLCRTTTLRAVKATQAIMRSIALCCTTGTWYS
mmetsp:Transcript_20179/g.63199  ORF Transcript_20179/g.63199 Transcript_20179/m.63199 type:complete len:240 (-) Transcript_20179:1874-2593(-)